MFKRIIQDFQKFDWLLCLGVLLLFCLGLAAIYSVSLSQEQADFNDFNKQIVFGVIGFLLLFIISLINYSSWWVHSRLIFVAILSMLTLVLFIGTTVRGTRGWFSIGGLGLQPVELAKVALIILLAKFFSNRFQRFNSSKHVIVSLGIFLAMAIPVMFQPDLGSTLILAGCWFILLVLTGVDKKYIVVLLIIAVVFSMLSWVLFLEDYQKERIMVFINPQLDPLGGGYNVSQSIIGIGSGRLWGRGLGFGSQSQLRFIPEAQTDFIFAVIAEELGLFGVSLVLGLCGLIFYRLIKIAKQARNDFGLFIVLGVMVIFFLHIMVNVGMNMGIMPVMGISLPFLSYGGSFLIACLIMVGLAESVAVHR
ncbi:rod shape-determining protein RodA [Candidatus Falkowbacteria bacterium]|jgi:rod shape determining protein RodA|nr:rod shape-determining protein RodA [Candidatus Falkowbacteria bacterium]MBT5503584.1 rod shape-determining protein RodA [Candidatus Falkowbacteria bacterium]MBT6573621.1 rod shape-determining protein RodA [Candidatus Falkowbacteria bacterium]MBT7348429.1 rod shape-determining protein RodA [Candidatus Falkowbacteria bacterium]MBT7500617.1 rod shape-determining protein RodA [Candidatus Falkowbacteria bacterium]